MAWWVGDASLGYRCLCASDDGVQLWDAVGAGTLRQTIGVGAVCGTPTTLSLHPDGKHMCIGTKEHTVWVYVVKAGPSPDQQLELEPVSQVLRTTLPVTFVQFTQTRIVVGCEDGDIRLLPWPLNASSELTSSAEVFKSPLGLLVFGSVNKSETQLAALTSDRTLVVFEISSKQILHNRPGKSPLTKKLTNVALSWDSSGSLLFVPSGIEVAVLDTSNWKEVTSYVVSYDMEVTHALFETSAKVLCTVASDGESYELSMWGYPQQKKLFKNQCNSVRHISWSPNAHSLAAVTPQGVSFFANAAESKKPKTPEKSETTASSESESSEEEADSMLDLAAKSVHGDIDGSLSESSEESSDTNTKPNSELPPKNKEKENIDDNEKSAIQEDENDSFVVEDDIKVIENKPKGHTPAPFHPILQPDSFQPTATPWRQKQRFLSINGLGSIITIEDHDANNIVIELTNHKKTFIKDTSVFSAAALASSAAVFATEHLVSVKLYNGATTPPIHTAVSEWTRVFPQEDPITCLAMNEKVVVITSQSFLYMFTLTGIQIFMSVLCGKALCLCAKATRAALAYSSQSGQCYFTEFDTSLSHGVVEIISQGMLPQNNIKWFGFSDENLDLLCEDCKGMLCKKTLASSTDTNSTLWVPVLVLKPNQWLVDVTSTDSALVAKCEEGKHYPTTTPLPLFVLIPFFVPLLAESHPQEEEKYLSCCMSLNSAISTIWPTDTDWRNTAKKLTEIDVVLYQLFKHACSTFNHDRAVDLCKQMYLPKGIQMCQKYANDQRQIGLATRIQEILEAKTAGVEPLPAAATPVDKVCHKAFMPFHPHPTRTTTADSSANSNANLSTASPTPSPSPPQPQPQPTDSSCSTLPQPAPISTTNKPEPLAPSTSSTKTTKPTPVPTRSASIQQTLQGVRLSSLLSRPAVATSKHNNNNTSTPQKQQSAVAPPTPSASGSTPTGDASNQANGSTNTTTTSASANASSDQAVPAQVEQSSSSPLGALSALCAASSASSGATSDRKRPKLSPTATKQKTPAKRGRC
ncbi:WD repeat and HMG-box DNA-binding protein 1 [Pelomyxa schiedti]|nr:WD repeat and HMG-box DNA-binding protein 1 [Pelomyxa schiedti]